MIERVSTTAEDLGRFRKELVGEGMSSDLADRLVVMMFDSFVRDSTVVVRNG